ncbi:MAG: Glutamate-1-semialdehyde 2,1-aminomutase [Chlamydiae bacterium]|nr:Glutamate-1-semialdehyde 2,1-aminomutase [Chlamydiota bacterium]
MYKTMRSQELYEKLCKVIPGGVNSPVRAWKGMGQPPMVVESGVKDCVYDVEGNKYLDFCGSWGALIHGHAHPQILDAVQKRMAKGTTFGITSGIEEQLASKVVGLIDSVEKVRFVCSGTEATMSAVRLTRGFTGRKIVVKFNGNYHGHADFFLVNAGSGVMELSSTSSSAGIPDEVVQHVVSLPYNDIDTTRQYLQTHEVAAVILEPIAGNMGVVPAKKEFIEMLRNETEKQGALLIFDEVISGFRVALKGAQSLYHVKPDLTCFGKVIGGGFPVAAFGGRKEVMDFLAPEGPVYQAGTLAGNPLAMEAGYQALSMLERDGFYEELKRKTNIITEPVRNFIKDKNLDLCVQQVGSMFTIFFSRKEVNNQEEAKTLDLEKFAEFFRYMYANGVYIPPSQHEAWFVSQAHEEEHLESTRDLVLEFIDRSA